jgi:hypothetical protein
MARLNLTPRLAHTEEALTVLFCLIDDAYAHLNPHAGPLRIHKAALGLGGLEAGTLAATEGCGERTLLLGRRTEVFLALVSRSGGALHHSSFHRRLRKLRRFLEPLQREILSEMVGDPETLLVDSRLLSVLHPLLRFLRAVQACVGQRG